MKPLYSRGGRGVAVQSQMWNSMSQSQHFSSFMMQQPACYLAVGIETMILLLGKKPQWHFLTTWSIQLGVLVKTSRKKFLRAEEQWNNFALGMLKTFVDESFDVNIDKTCFDQRIKPNPEVFSAIVFNRKVSSCSLEWRTGRKSLIMRLWPAGLRSFYPRAWAQLVQ